MFMKMQMNWFMEQGPYNVKWGSWPRWPFEFPHDDNIPFSKLLFDLTILWVQPFDNDDANLNMPIFDNSIQVFDTLPRLECTYSNSPKLTRAHAINGFHQSATP
jgi:hypothetical protein